ncbi:pyridoxamine 5'-phosphate oxidase family protein [Mechercharimyces sp. CAU 1602]|uniref:pyridoxamine 5'-phosphate oxidase family protein n=1 Tax=Mechercharimyces sp. CAU 1602 TaxID=2973933 RepID=UPI002161EE14|nr:pyridoxamine 5'-phosphate oxidase family protein [Mechercharimyces sp. CAU 1602]MCS1350581.1 pyridoxamine 5'-phosphate oxidase family protein [Mechercharimyces sp. CAU 1602]
MAKQITTLDRPLYNKLQREGYVLLATMDKETGAPQMNAISWVYAPSEQLIRMAVHDQSRIVENVQAHPLLAITMIAEGSTYEIACRVKGVQASIPDVKIKLALIEAEVQTVRDVMFYGAKMIQEPRFDKTYDKEAAEKLDQQVMAALKQG